MSMTPDPLAGGSTAGARIHPWDPDHPAVVVETDAGSSRVFQIRHDSYPFEADWDDDGRLDGLFGIASWYLLCLLGRLPISEDLLQRLVPTSSLFPDGLLLAWMRKQDDPKHSRWVNRRRGLTTPAQPGSGDLLDRTAVLLAGLTVFPGRDTGFLLGGQGLRILACASPAENGVARVRIRGVTSTLPALGAASEFAALNTALPQIFQRAATTAVAAFGLPANVAQTDLGLTLVVHPSRTLADSTEIIFRSKTVLPPTVEKDSLQATATSQALTLSLPIYSPLPTSAFQQPLIAFAQALVFEQDPVSGTGAEAFSRLRPRRAGSELDKHRTHADLGSLDQGTVVDTVKLANPDFAVQNARLIDAPFDESQPKEVADPSHADVLSDEFAAVNAFHHTAGLFLRLRLCGLLPTDYFRFASLPLEVRYRSGIIPGFGDGRTVNAQVRWTLRQTPSGGPASRKLEVRFALGDLYRATGRLPANKRSAIEHTPLGVASDPRWCWHEFGHVLVAAAIGELEFRFAHSAGDALAAILSDPHSELACDAAGAAANDSAWRGVTFPWIHIPRRHDRDVQRGWAWCSDMGSAGPAYAREGPSGKHGYWTEQILSSSLFRLYRAIGGDCSTTGMDGRSVPDRGAREAAADYTAYLIIRAIDLLGPAAVTPCEDVRAFVDALCKTDIATAVDPGPGGYIGGTVHKVVQWAFERQGLYGVPIPGSPIIGPEGPMGSATAVDLHIDDRRPQTDGPYSPVDLNTGLWHASPNAIAIQDAAEGSATSREIAVTVKNRGASPASQVRLDVLYAPVVDGAIPGYPGPEWLHVGSATADVPGNDGAVPGETAFPPLPWEPPASGNFAILASASCAADRSNIDPATGFPGASEAGPVPFLVAFDNNLGLAIVQVA